MQHSLYSIRIGSRRKFVQEFLSPNWEQVLLQPSNVLQGCSTSVRKEVHEEYPLLPRSQFTWHLVFIFIWPNFPKSQKPGQDQVYKGIMKESSGEGDGSKLSDCIALPTPVCNAATFALDFLFDLQDREWAFRGSFTSQALMKSLVAVLGELCCLQLGCVRQVCGHQFFVLIFLIQSEGFPSIPNHAQSLPILALHSGITTERTQGILQDAGDRALVGLQQGKCSTHCTLALIPVVFLLAMYFPSFGNCSALQSYQ